MTLSDKEHARRRKHRALITTKEVHIAGGRAAGRIAAEKVGFLDSIRTPESCRLGGQRGGRATAKSGKLAATGLGLGIKTPESLAKGGFVQGTRNASSGFMRHMALIRYEKNHSDCRFCNPPTSEQQEREK